MQQYPLDHPLRRMALAYFETFEDEYALRYVLQTFDSMSSHYDLEEDEFRDVLEFILNELLYNEDDVLIAAALHTLAIVIAKNGFPEQYCDATLERLAMLERLFVEEGVVIAGLAQCIMSVWVCRSDAYKEKSLALLNQLLKDEENVHRLKGVVRALGAVMSMPGLSEGYAKSCLSFLDAIFEANDDCRIKVYVAESLSLAIEEGFVLDPAIVAALMDRVEGFLDERFKQSLLRPVAEFFSKVLTFAELSEQQVDHCWQILFRIPKMVKEGGTQSATLQHLGKAMHWKAMTPKQEDQCYDIFRSVLDTAETEKTLDNLLIIIAQAITGMYSWGRTEFIQRWGALFRDLLLEVEPLRAYHCLNTFLQGPMASVCFTPQDLDLLAGDVLAYAEKDEKGLQLCIQVLDAMVSSSLLNPDYFERFWGILEKSWAKGAFMNQEALWTYLSHSASGLVCALGAPEPLRKKLFNNLTGLLESVATNDEKLFPLIQVFPVLMALSERLPKGAWMQCVELMLPFASYPKASIAAVALDGLEMALSHEGLSEDMRKRVADAVLSLDVSHEGEVFQMAYVRASLALEKFPAFRERAVGELSRLHRSSSITAIKRLIEVGMPEA